MVRRLINVLKLHHTLIGVLSVFFISTYSSLSTAQVRVEVSGVGTTQFPVALANFAGDASQSNIVNKIISSDLVRSGLFKTIDTPNGANENCAQLEPTPFLLAQSIS
jgi:TolB protein